MTHKSVEIEKKVLKKVTPSEKDRKNLFEVIQELRQKIEGEIKKKKINAETVLVGSTAKDTFLKDSLDIDLFLVFPTNIEKEEIAKNAISIGRKLLKDAEECYAEHPYIRGVFKNQKVEIVPCYKIEHASQKLSAVDRTPLHTKYVKENITDSQKSEVLLLKQFLKGIDCYGAEAEIEGFSGYLCEILILKFNTLRKLLADAQSWKPGVKLSLTTEKSPSFDTPLVFIDPVDIERNVASALSGDKFDLFVKASKVYLKKPDVTFFFPNDTKPWSLDDISKELVKQKSLFVGVKIFKPDILDENLYPQVRKAVRSIWENCKRYGFKIHDVIFHVNDLVVIVVRTDDEPLSDTFIHVGPPVNLKDNADEFLKKWKGNPRVVKEPFEDKGRLFVELKREFTQRSDFLNGQVKDLI